MLNFYNIIMATRNTVIMKFFYGISIICFVIRTSSCKDSKLESKCFFQQKNGIAQYTSYKQNRDSAQILLPQKIPKNISLNMDKCIGGKVIKIVMVMFSRPYAGGDTCYSHRDNICRSNLDSCCCFNKNSTMCNIKAQGNFDKFYNLLLSKCNGKPKCTVDNVSSVNLADYCKQDQTSSEYRCTDCWARKIHVYYNCTFQTEAVNPGTTTDITTAGSILVDPDGRTIAGPTLQNPHKFSLGDILAVSISLVGLIAILLIVIILLCLRKKKSNAEKPKQNNIAMEFQTHTTDGSTLHLCQNESDTAKATSQMFLNNTIPQDTCSSSPRELPPGMIENNYYEGGPSLKERPALPEIPKQNCYEGVGASGGEPYSDDPKPDLTDDNTNSYGGDDIPTTNDTTNKMLHDNLENYMKEIFKFIETPVLDLDLDNNNQSIDNIYETIPENGYRSDKSKPQEDTTVIEPLMASCSDQALPSVSAKENPPENDYTYTYGHFNKEGRERGPYKKT